MLIGTVFAISFVAAVLVCVLAGAFEGLAFLWLLPACFAGVFVLLALLWCALLLVMTKAVDMQKEQQKDSFFYRKVIELTVDALIAVLRVRIETRGLEQLPQSGRFMLVCNHLHDTDPVILLWAFRHSQLAFISKRENNEKFLIGPFLHKLMCQPINRENDREALKTILKCIQIIKEDKVSLGVFPEGYVSLDRLLHPFRGGVFKIAQKANVPIVVCTLQNTFDIYKNMKALKPTRVELHLLGVIPPEELAGRTAVDIADQVHEMMARDLGPDKVLPPQDDENPS